MADHTLFVCSERGNPCLFWQWAHVFEGIKPICKYGLACRTNKVTKECPIIKIAYSTVVPTKEKAPVNYLNGDVSKTRRVFIRLGACLAARVSIGTRSQILVKHLRVQRPILLKKPSKNSYIKISVDELVEGITKLNIC